MIFFNKNKPKFKRENIQDDVKFSIEYYRFNEPAGYKLELFKKIIGSGVCMAVINTKCMYKEQNNDYSNDQHELLSRLDKLNIHYKKVAVKRKKESVILGFSVIQNGNKIYYDYIIGLVIRRDNIEDIAPILERYNLHYFIDYNKYNADELLNKFGSSFDDEEELRSEFKYCIFNDNFLKHMVIYCKKEDSEFISNILNELD